MTLTPAEEVAKSMLAIKLQMVALKYPEFKGLKEAMEKQDKMQPVLNPEDLRHLSYIKFWRGPIPTMDPILPLIHYKYMKWLQEAGLSLLLEYNRDSTRSNGLFIALAKV